MAVILILALAGVLFICLEIILPGMVLGIAGGVASVAAIVLCFTTDDLAGLGFIGRALVASGITLASLTLIGLWLKYFDRFSFGRKLILGPEIDAKLPLGDASLLGAQGIAHSDLRPTGRASVEGVPKTCDIIAESGFIPGGSAIEVVKVQGRRVLVRALPQEAAPADDSPAAT